MSFFNRSKKIAKSYINDALHEDQHFSCSHAFFAQKELHGNKEESNTDDDLNTLTQTKEQLYLANLELQSVESFDQVHLQYKNLMKTYHPDLFGHDFKKREYAEAISQQLNEAYDYFKKKYKGVNYE